LTAYVLVIGPETERDVEAAFVWYEGERASLGLRFSQELRATYARILDRPFGYQVVRAGVRRAMMRRFPYAVFYAIEDDVILVTAVLHTSRDPAEWQRRLER
jgi:plasmid stabilization system protein ParE